MLVPVPKFLELSSKLLISAALRGAGAQSAVQLPASWKCTDLGFRSVRFGFSVRTVSLLYRRSTVRVFLSEMVPIKGHSR